jgi:hypothetical protein
LFWFVSLFHRHSEERGGAAIHVARVLAPRDRLVGSRRRAEDA